MRGGETITPAGDCARQVCFPESAVVALGEVMVDRTRCEVGLVGAEGVIGWPALLGVTQPSYIGMVQMRGGTALFADADAILAACTTSSRLQLILLRFVHSFTEQMTGTLIGALRDNVEQRLARWLLMLHDRVAGDVLHVTHGELAGALHVRRASVTDCLHVLEGKSVVRCSRGQLIVRDRAALRRAAGESYGVAEDSYRRLIGPFGS